jgi:hypothetical protein
MSDASNMPESVRLAAEQHGLGRALESFPEIFKDAAERGLNPLGEPRQGLPPTTSPAPIFNPARFDHDK